MQPASPLHRIQDLGQGWLLGAALLQRAHLVVIQQLLIKGLFNQDTQLVTVQVSVATSALVRLALSLAFSYCAAPCGDITPVVVHDTTASSAS